MLEARIEPAAGFSRQGLHAALSEMAAADSAFTFYADPTSGAVFLVAMSVLDLRVKAEVLRLAYGIDADVGPPRSPYRETILRRADIRYAYKQPMGPTPQFALVRIVFEPTVRGGGYGFEDRIIGGAVPRAFVSGVERGLALAKDQGLIAGFPVIDFKAALVDGAYHDIDSGVEAFEIAARAAFRELRDAGEPKRLEPMMLIEVETPTSEVEAVSERLELGRMRVRGIVRSGLTALVSSMAPLADTFGLRCDLVELDVAADRVAVTLDHYAEIGGDGGPDLFPSAAALRG
jgi:elongation factor G